MHYSLQASFLRTRFGRRMLLLFLTCAMLPLATLIAIVLSETSAEMNREARDRLRRTAKAMGMSIIDQVNALAEESQRMARAAASGRGEKLRDLMGEREMERVRGVRVTDASGATVAMWRPDAFSILTQPVSARREKTLLFPATSNSSRMVVVESAHTVNERALHVYALTDPERFFGATDVQGWRDSGTQACVMLGSEALWCSVRRALWSQVRGVGESVVLEGRRYAAAAWSGFAPLSEAGGELTVLAFIETPDTLGNRRSFRRSLILLVLSSLVLVFLASHVQLRRSLRPLEDLTRATQQVGAHNLTVRVEAPNDDEFGALARSFNAMSNRISSHVALLSSTAAINDEALRASNVRDLLPRLTLHVRALLPEQYGMSLAVRVEQTLWLRRSVMTRSAEWVDDELELGPGGLRELQRGDVISGRFAQDPKPYLLAPSSHPGWRSPAVVIPLSAERELVGIMTVLVPDGTLATNAVLENVRTIASELALAVNRARLVGHLEQLNYGTLTALARTVDAKSPWTAGHSESVTYAAMCLGERLRLTSDELDVLHRGSLLHDIGKIAVPGAILDKPGRLTPEEMAVVQSHPEVGARILAPIEAYAPMLPIVLYHHERFDGKGYPRGLRGDAIPRLARLVAVVDVYDALVSDRPYREGWLPERALEHIQSNAGTHFDPVMAHAFAGVENDLRHWYTERRDEHLERRGGRPVVAPLTPA